MELPSEETLRWIVTRYARLAAAHREALGEAVLIEPSGKFFPDEFVGDGESVGLLFQRMLGYAPLDEDLPVELAVIEPAEASQGGGGCGSGACGTGAKIGPTGGVVDLGSRYRVEIAVADAGHTTLLTSSLARSLGGLVLAEAGEKVDAREAGAMSELTATIVGFGVLLTNGAAVYAKGCGGLKLHRATHLSVEELSVALALFCGVQRIRPSRARAHFEVTQREAFDEAVRFMESNQAIVEALRDQPELLEGGLFELSPARGVLGRLFARRASSELPQRGTAPARAPRTEAERAKLLEAKALVDEAFGDAE